MTFATLQYNGVEKSLADWGIATCVREASNQAHDHVALDMMLAADAADPFPYGSQIILRIGRTASNSTNAAGLPVTGITSWGGGQTFFVGWRVETFRTGSPSVEKLDFKFAGPWEFFFERLVFQKLWYTWNGKPVGSGGANVADWRSQVVLGLSVTAMTGAGDTIPMTSQTNLMSIRQQVAEIIAYVKAQTASDYGSAQIQSDNLTAGIDGVNYDLINSYPGNFPSGLNLLIPDFIAGVYASGGKTSGSANLQTVLRAPLDAVTEVTCADAIRRQLKWVGPLGECVVWFDYTTTSGGNPCPTLHVGSRDVLPSISLPMIGQNAGFKIKKRDDLIPGCVALAYRVTGTYNGTPYVDVIHDIATTIGGTVTEGIGQVGALYTLATFAGGSPAAIAGGTQTTMQNAARDFVAVRATIDMEGNSNSVARCTIATVGVNLTDFTANGFWQHVFPEFRTMTTAPTLFTGSTVTCLVENPGNANPLIPNDQTDIVAGGQLASTYVYLLTDGQIAPWMLAGNTSGGAGALVVQATIKAQFNITKTTIGNISGTPVNLPGGKSPYVEKTARVTLVSIPGGNYQVQTSSTQGEVVPYGLAGYIYGLTLIPQFEGSFTIQETEVTDQCPMGNNLNISGGLAAWATMNACVQQVSYDMVDGKTTLTFGPSAHLGAKEFAERLKVNRSPIRGVYGIGMNVTNNSAGNGGTQLGNSVAQRGPSPGVQHDGQSIMPADSTLADWSNHNSSYTTPGSGTGVPGIVLDSGSSGQPNYGVFPGNSAGLSAPNKPTIVLSTGSGGSLTRAIRISVADLIGTNKQAWFQPMSVCVNVGGTPTSMTTYVLCTTPE